MSRDDPTDSALTPALGERVDSACDRFEADWKSGRRPVLEDLLGGLSGRDREVMLRELLRIELAYRSKFGERVDSADYRARFPDDVATLDELIHDPDATASLLEEGTTLLATQSGRDIALQPDERFRALRPHAKGGLGEVFVALDTQLNRHVALKRILRHHADDAGTRRRFVLEAEVTGGLEHPGIVPVYGLGASADGHPYYAMRFVRGESLRQAIKEFHRADAQGRRDPAERTLALRGLLGRFVAVCNAVAYAHSRGVIHRDLKPDNILLGPYGEALLVDWGLAKVLGADGPAARGEEPLGPAALAADGATRTGTLLGTPAYMSPEQVEGRNERVGTASDVYGLGATLYALLAGKSPGGEGPVAEVLERVGSGAIPPARELNPRVHPALEAICRKAMAREPEGRYADPRTLAADVERWLADEPVTAYREPLVDRVRRGMRRHRTWVATGAAAALVALLGLAATVFVLDRANREEARLNGRLRRANDELTAANRRETRARERSDYWLDTAMGSMKDYYTGVTEDVLLKEERLADLRARLLEKPRGFYERLTREQDAAPPDMPARRRLAEGHLGLGRILFQVGKLEGAIEEYRLSLAGYEALASAEADRSDHREMSAQVGGDLGAALFRLGRPVDAVAAYRRAIATREALPEAAYERSDLAAHHSTLAYVLTEMGRVREADAALVRSLAIRSALPATPTNRRGMAEVHAKRAILLDRTGRADESIAESGRGIAFYEALLAADPKDEDALTGLASCLFNLANVLTAKGRLDEAVATNRRGIEAFEALLASKPNVPHYRQSLANGRGNLGNVLAQMGRFGEAAAAFAPAIKDAESLAAAIPDNANYLQQHGGLLINRGVALMMADRHVEAVDDFRLAIVPLRAAFAKAPDLTQSRLFLSNGYGAMAESLRALGRGREAAAATGERRRLWPGNPDELYAVAGELAQCVPLARDDVERAGFIAESLSALRDSVAAGRPDPDKVAADPDLAPLREDPGFRSLIDGLRDRSFPADVFAR